MSHSNLKSAYLHCSPRLPQQRDWYNNKNALCTPVLLFQVLIFASVSKSAKKQLHRDHILNIHQPPGPYDGKRNPASANFTTKPPMLVIQSSCTRLMKARAADIIIKPIETMTWAFDRGRLSKVWQRWRCKVGPGAEEIYEWGKSRICEPSLQTLSRWLSHANQHVLVLKSLFW
jgi:hypothetical protein